MATVTVQLYPYKMPAAVLKNVQAGASGSGVSQVSKSAADKILDFLKKTASGGGGGGGFGFGGGKGSGDGTPGNYTAGQLVTTDETVYLDKNGNIVDQDGNVVLDAGENMTDPDGNIVDQDGNILIPAGQISDSYYEDAFGDTSTDSGDTGDGYI